MENGGFKGFPQADLDFLSQVGSELNNGDQYVDRGILQGEAMLAQPEAEHKVDINRFSAQTISYLIPELKPTLTKNLTEEEAERVGMQVNRLSGKMEDYFVQNEYPHGPMLGITVSEIKILKQTAVRRSNVLPYDIGELYLKKVRGVLKEIKGQLKSDGHTELVNEIWPRKRHKPLFGFFDLG